MAETHEIKIETEVLSSKTIYKGKTTRLEIHDYWDSHGTNVDWGKREKEFSHEVEIEIVSKQVRYDFGPHVAPQVFEVWDLLVNGKKYDLEAELTGYKALKTKLVLSACVGAG